MTNHRRTEDTYGDILVSSKSGEKDIYMGNYNWLAQKPPCGNGHKLHQG